MSQRRGNENPKVFDAQKSEQALRALVRLLACQAAHDTFQAACSTVDTEPLEARPASGSANLEGGA
jgi:hypothetical protein